MALDFECGLSPQSLQTLRNQQRKRKWIGWGSAYGSYEQDDLKAEEMEGSTSRIDGVPPFLSKIPWYLARLS